MQTENAEELDVSSVICRVGFIHAFFCLLAQPYDKYEKVSIPSKLTGNEIVLTRCNSNLQDHSSDCYIGSIIYNYHTICFAQWCINSRKYVFNK